MFIETGFSCGKCFLERWNSGDDQSPQVILRACTHSLTLFINQHRCAQSYQLAWPGIFFRSIVPLFTEFTDNWLSSFHIIHCHFFVFFWSSTFVKLHSHMHVVLWGMSFCLHLLNAATFCKINKLNHKRLCLPGKVYIGQTVKAQFCFANCKTETHFAEL